MGIRFILSNKDDSFMDEVVAIIYLSGNLRWFLVREQIRL